MVLDNATIKIKPSDHYVKTNTAVQTGKKGLVAQVQGEAYHGKYVFYVLAI